MKPVLLVALVVFALGGSTLVGCRTTLAPTYLGVRPGAARYGVSFVGSSGKLSATGSATVTQIGVQFTESGWIEQTDTTSDLPRALAHTSASGSGTLSTRAPSGFDWQAMGERDDVVLFALKRVFRIIDFRPEEAGPATVEIRPVHEPAPGDPSASYVIRFSSERGGRVRVDLVLRPDVGLASAVATTDAGEWKLHLELDPPG